jgi:hypothetical protein
MAAGVIVVATRGSTPVAQAETRLGAVKDARIVSASGVARIARAGEALRDGDVVITGSGGSAVLFTRGRTTLLGGSAALAVIDGGKQQLRTGTAVVNAILGPPLSLDLSGDVVAIPHGSATEAARGVSIRIGALAGPAAITSTSGRQLALPALSQAVLSGDALPGGTTPLHLTDSAAEAQAVPRLVADDLALNTLARGIDTTGRSTAHLIEASWTGTVEPAPGGVSRSERVLPVLIADSTHGGTAQQRYDSAVTWRAEGGSWGVVLHLLAGRASSVESTLAELQKRGQTPGQIGTVGPVAATISAVGVPRAFTTSPPRTGHPRHGGHRGHGGATPAGGTTSPAPPDNLLGGLVATVQSVINGVFGILPHGPASPTASPSPKPTAAAAKTAVSTKAAQTTTTSSRPASTTTQTRAAAPKAAPKAAPSPTPSPGLLRSVVGGLLGSH